MKKNINNQRRQLVNAVWAVPAVQLISLPSHAQATPTLPPTTLPLSCTEQGTTRWQLIESEIVNADGSITAETLIDQTTDIFTVEINGSDYVGTINANGVTRALVAGVDFPFFGFRDMTGSYDAATQIVTIESCTIRAGSQNLACLETPFTFVLDCEKDTITTVGINAVGATSTLTYKRLP